MSGTGRDGVTAFVSDLRARGDLGGAVWRRAEESDTKLVLDVVRIIGRCLPALDIVGRVTEEESVEGTVTRPNLR